MAFSFDSLSFDSLAAALLLFAAALTGWRLAAAARGPARLNIRFACLLFAGLAAAGLAMAFQPAFGDVVLVVALLAASLGSAALALGFCRGAVKPAIASVALVAALGAGLAAGLLNAPVYALAVQVIAAAFVIVAGFGRLGENLLKGAEAIAGAFALICAGMTLMDRAATLSLVFFAAGLIGLARASQAGIEPRGRAGFARG